MLNHRCAQFQGPEGLWNQYGGKLNWDARAIVSDDPHFGGGRDVTRAARDFYTPRTQAIINWIDDAGGTSGAFDVTTKGIMHAVFERQEYWRLCDSEGRPPGVVGLWPSRAVTFIENHDTGSTQGHWRFPEGFETQGYVYILTHPGTPTVFWDHLFEWHDKSLGDTIVRLMEIRRAVHPLEIRRPPTRRRARVLRRVDRRVARDENRRRGFLPGRGRGDIIRGDGVVPSCRDVRPEVRGEEATDATARPDEQKEQKPRSSADALFSFRKERTTQPGSTTIADRRRSRSGVRLVRR